MLRQEPSLARTVIVDEKGVGRTLLHVAVDWPGHWPRAAETIALLIAAGADPNLPITGAGYHEERPLHGAASSDDVIAIDALLDGGADIEAPGAVFTGGAAMSDAVIFAQWKAARRLLERGAKTTFTQAAALGLRGQLEDELASGAWTAEDITKALWHAARGGQRSIVEMLVAAGGDPGWLGWDGMTPAVAAARQGHAELAKWLASGCGR